MTALMSGTFWGGWALWVGGAFLGRAWARMWGTGILALQDVAQAAVALARGNGWVAVLDVVLGAVWAWLWWSERKRKRRDPAAKTLGAKSRLLVAAIVERAREAAKPKPVLRPVPGGAGA